MEGFKIIDKSPNIIWVNKESLEERIDCNPYKVNYLENEQMIKGKIPYQTIEELIRSPKDLTGGATPLGANYLDRGVRFIRTQNIGRNYMDLKDVVYISKEDNSKLKRSILQEDDVLLTITGADFGRIATVTKECLPANINQHSVRIHFKGHMDPFYVAVFLNSLYGQSQIFRYSVGATRPAIDYSAIKNIKIPIPSSEIQKYIGDKVRKSEELREEAKRLEYDLKEIINELVSIEISKSVMWNLNPIYISDRLDCEYNYKYFYEIESKFKKSGLNVIEFGSLIEKKMSEPQTDSSDFIQNGIPVLRITDIQEDSLNFDSCAKISEDVYEKLKAFQLIPDDIIFGLSGTVGRAVVVPKEIPEKVITNRRVAKVTLKDTKLAYYIASFLNSEYGVDQMLREATGGVQKNLRLEDIGKIKIPLPKKEQMYLIASKAKEKTYLLNKSKQLIKEAKKDVEDLIEGNFDMSKLNQS